MQICIHFLDILFWSKWVLISIASKIFPPLELSLRRAQGLYDQKVGHFHRICFTGGSKYQGFTHIKGHFVNNWSILGVELECLFAFYFLHNNLSRNQMIQISNLLILESPCFENIIICFEPAENKMQINSIPKMNVGATKEKFHASTKILKKNVIPSEKIK